MESSAVKLLKVFAWIEFGVILLTLLLYKMNPIQGNITACKYAVISFVFTQVVITILKAPKRDKKKRNYRRF